MANPRPDSELKWVQEQLDKGVSLHECARQLKCDVGALHRSMKRYRKRGEKPVPDSPPPPTPKVVKQTKAEVPEEQLSVVNQLEGQVGILRDEIRVLKHQLAAAQKESVNLRMLAAEVKSMIKPFDSPPESWKKLIKGPCEESVVLHLSDGHHDSVILPHRVQNLERHDFNISMARGETLVEAVLNFTKNRMTGYNFNTLWILAYGDHTNGEIHGADRHSHFGNMMRSCLAIGQFHGQMIRDLAEWFQEVKVLYLSGNHGRRKEVRKKDYHAAWDSWDYLIAEIAKSYVSNLWNVEVLIPDSFSSVVDVEGFKFCCFHGDDIKGWAGIPWYGIERKTRRLTALNAANDAKVNYYCLGHFHAMGTQAALKGETLINGAWVGCDPYSFNALDGYNEPMQLLHGVHRDHGVSWRLPIKLRTPDEVNGPKRYKISLAEEHLS